MLMIVKEDGLVISCGSEACCLCVMCTVEYVCAYGSC